MILALVAALALAQGKVPEGAGTLWLAGAEAEVPASEREALLLAAAAPDSHAPLDARPWGGDARTAILQVQDPGPDAEGLARVRAATRVLLGPGDLAQWRAALWDGERPRPLALALREAWSSGAEVAARGAGALVLGGAFIAIEPDEVARNPREREIAALRPGLGLLGGELVDGAARGGDLRALGLRMLDPGLERALWIPERGGLRCEPATGRRTGFEAQPALAFDGRAARRTGTRVEGMLVEWLVEGRTGGARDALRAEPVAPPARATAQVVPEAWSYAAWAAAPAPGSERAWSSGGVALRVHGLPQLGSRAPAARLALELAR